MNDIAELLDAPIEQNLWLKRLRLPELKGLKTALERRLNQQIPIVFD